MVTMEKAKIAINTQKADEAYERIKLSGEVYKELESVVGERFISEENFVVCSHDWWGIGADPGVEPLVGKPPSAVVLPSTTEEVAAIVKICNKYGVKFKAHSTGYGSYSGVGEKGAISVDLRRMDKLEIDPVSRMAVIGPYATAGKLMSEGLKHGLMNHMVGAGALHSPLGSATSFAGMGVPGNHTGINYRNLLSFEWVSPEGEIVRGGSAGSGAGWFTGEGPGPGFRGMLRGIIGATGGLGIFTQIGYKMYPWAGPEKIEFTGEHPIVGIAPPENSATYQLGWKSWGNLTKATHLLKNEQVVSFITRTPPHSLGHFFTRSNTEYYEHYKEGKLSKLTDFNNAITWTVTIMAWSKREFEWKEKALETILAQTGGFKHDITEQERDILTANNFISMYVHRHGRPAGGGGISQGILDSVDHIPNLVTMGEKFMKHGQRKGGEFYEGAKEANWMWLTEGRHFWSENNPLSTKNAKDVSETVYFVLANFAKLARQPMGLSAFIIAAMADIFVPHLDGANNWIRKTKNMWDPKNLSSSASYISPEPGPQAKAGWILRNVLTRPLFKPLLKFVLGKQFK